MNHRYKDITQFMTTFNANKLFCCFVYRLKLISTKILRKK